jgi:hypothetical protein
MTQRPPRVDFPIWDTGEEPSLMPMEFATIEDGDGSITAVGLSRGAAPGEGKAVFVWSFAPQTAQRHPLWPMQHAAMGFVSPLAAALGVNHRQAVERINTCLEGAAAATLEVQGQLVTALTCSLYGDWAVTATTDPDIAVAVASSGRGQPATLRPWK